MSSTSDVQMIFDFIKAIFLFENYRDLKVGYTTLRLYIDCLYTKQYDNYITCYNWCVSNLPDEISEFFKTHQEYKITPWGRGNFTRTYDLEEFLDFYGIKHENGRSSEPIENVWVKIRHKINPALVDKNKCMENIQCSKDLIPIIMKLRDERKNEVQQLNDILELIVSCK